MKAFLLGLYISGIAACYTGIQAEKPVLMPVYAQVGIALVWPVCAATVMGDVMGRMYNQKHLVK